MIRAVLGYVATVKRRPEMNKSRSNVRRLIADVMLCGMLIVTSIPMTAKADDAAGLQQSAPASAETTENG